MKMDKSNSNKGNSNDHKMETEKQNSTKNKPKGRGKKRRRPTSDSSSEYEEIITENALELEKNLHASAVKNNLDETSVRKILKKVVTNDHVLALVKLREEEEGSGPEEKGLRPKLTRAKVKELMKVSPKAGPWNLDLTPIKHIPVKTRPEVKALIAQELPDDEDDDEYEPTHDDVPSDDDQGLESCSDLDSQPRTPATPHSLTASSPKVVKDGPFKVPQELSTSTRRKLDLEEEATIALRTRSKLSLSSTSIEHIESTFVPPDDLPMPAVDDLWNQFLNECLNPASTSKNEDDDETDPEYNVAADPDANDEDEEALGNGIIKISKKELNDLVTELFNIMPEATADDELMADHLASSVLTEHSQTDLSARWEGKQEPLSDEEKRGGFSDRITFEKKEYTRLSIGKTEPPGSPQQTEVRVSKSGKKKENRVATVCKPPRVAIEEIEVGESGSTAQRAPPPPLQRHLKQARNQCVTIQVDNGVCVLPEQIQILQQQLRQHIQLATSNYLQLYIHPIHWQMAPPYKEYLDTLDKLSKKNPKSVVNVCNLKPAVELVAMWENTVSANTPENKQMVEFVMNESERCRRRFTNKSTYVGEFHDTFKEVVANSPVFLYPYLLPPMPYRADHAKRYSYVRSEDELIALGLDQFWDYVDANPSIYKPRPVSNPRHRWGLAVTVQLVVKHMFPWIPYKVMLGHIQFVRKTNYDKDNPIYKFFTNRTITPVKHELLPFNPKLCLYEQPEHEVPKIWVRYLAKTSRRFRSYLLRRSNMHTVIPNGVEVQLGKLIPEQSKAPLPIDFTKEIVSNRINILPKTTQPIVPDKFDIQVAPPPTTYSTVPTNLFKLVETSTGAYLMPITNITSTVTTNQMPISSPAEVATKFTANNDPECSKTIQSLASKEHCPCCALLRKICKEKQTTITDYFKLKWTTKSCYCKDIKYPKVTKRLRILVSNYKSNSVNMLECLKTRLKNEKGKTFCKGGKEMDKDFDLDEFAFVTSFHLKLLTRSTVARDTLIKRRVYALISKFNPDEDDPVQLTKKLYEAFGVELVDMYKEFLCFLTPEQADICEGFRDYFVRNCVGDLVRKVEDQIENKEIRVKVLRKLQSVFYNNLKSACEICTDILSLLDGYPKLAQYVFNLFPHRKETRTEPKLPEVVPKTVQTVAQNQNTVPNEIHSEQANTAEEYEADNSSEEEEENNVDNLVNNDKNQLTVTNTEITTKDINIQPTINNIPDSPDSSSNSMIIDFEEDEIKKEISDWRRDEDKLILEILKEHLTPEERKDKTIMEMLDEKNIISMLAESLLEKSKDEITRRVLYLLEILVLSEKN